MATTHIDVDIAEAQSTVVAVLEKLGTPQHIARVVARSLVRSNQVGHDSHGLVRVPEYVRYVADGVIRPDVEPRIDRAHGAVAVVDAGAGWGHYAVDFAVSTLIPLARTFGTATVTVRNSKHIGRLGGYVERLADEGLASVILCNSDPNVALPGGRDRMLGTNPFAAGVPSSTSHPFVIDFATSAMAEGKVRVARDAGKDVPLGVIIDKNGRGSTDPNDYYEGGALLPFGGHKGFGLSVLIELLGGSLSGQHPALARDYRAGNGVVITAYDPAAFVDAHIFDRDVSDELEALRAARRADEGGTLILAGDVEQANLLGRTETIPVPSVLWDTIRALPEQR
jgi:hydroxycarboxylate dehydrogenase B